VAPIVVLWFRGSLFTAVRYDYYCLPGGLLAILRLDNLWASNKIDRRVELLEALHPLVDYWTLGTIVVDHKAFLVLLQPVRP
jgi:hypothetical protein